MLSLCTFLLVCSKKFYYIFFEFSCNTDHQPLKIYLTELGSGIIFLNWTVPVVSCVNPATASYNVTVTDYTANKKLKSLHITDTEFTYKLPDLHWCSEYLFDVVVVNSTCKPEEKDGTVYKETNMSPQVLDSLKVEGNTSEFTYRLIMV